MKAEDWLELQRALDPRDLESVQRFAASLALNAPFVFSTDGRLSMSLEGPGAAELSEAVLALIGHEALRHQTGGQATSEAMQ